MSVSAVKNTPDEYEDDFEKDLDWLISEESKSEEQVRESKHNNGRNRFISWRQSSGIVCGILLHRRCTCVCEIHPTDTDPYTLSLTQRTMSHGVALFNTYALCI